MEEKSKEPDSKAKFAGRYDKGDRRMKHVGTGPSPVIEFDERNPRRFVGKCPRGLERKAVTILESSIAGAVGDRAGGYSKYRYAVHEGAIYEAASSDHGQTYHGYPYRGNLPRHLVKQLRDRAIALKCHDAFDRWIRDHITYQGNLAP
jgi:hypothetical protein